MPRNLAKIFRPRSVAVIGASNQEKSVGRTVLENMFQAGFPGEIYPVNPKRPTVLDRRAFPTVGSLPTVPDLAIIATPAATVPAIVRQCGEAGVFGLIILSAGFREVGPAGEAIENQLAAEIAAFPAMRVIGPNCLGVMVPDTRLNASFAADMPSPGRIAFISQSGALCTSILDWSLSERVGFSHFVSIGNSLNVSVGNLIDYFAEDPLTDSIVLYVESVTGARQFMSAARAFTRTKPIVVYKAGRFAKSAEAAASHTGAMAGVDAVYEAAFRRAGMVRVYNSEDMFDCAELLARHRTPESDRLAVVTNAGGPGVMAVDALLDRQGTLAELELATIAKLNSVLPPHWSRRNPVDILGDAGPRRFADAIEITLGDPGVDAALVVLTPQAMTDPVGTAIRVADVRAKTRKPILAAWMGGLSVEPGRQILNQAGIATYDSPDRAVRAFMYLVSYRRNREILYETPRQIPVNGSVKTKLARQQVESTLARGRITLTEDEAKAMLAAFGIPTSVPRRADSAAEAVMVSREIGYPVVMKIHSPQILHKTEVRGVTLNLASDLEVEREFSEMIARAKRMRPDATILGVTLQPMLASAEGVELIIGSKQDPVFGAVMMVGAGGVTAEVLGDLALELPPLNERLARRMIDSLRIRPLLSGFRGRPALDTERLIEALMRVSYLIAESPEIHELDINPLLVTPAGATALDARVVFKPLHPESKPRPYPHLAIRPYPEEYTRRISLKDGTSVLLRPIGPEDEPLWHAHLRNCSERSIWLRFRYLFKESTHEMATRFCFIDYDRTMAIVAEVESAGQREIVGVGRLVADADHRQAEYAVLVADKWQGRGLGSAITDYCFEICKTWDIDRVYAETTADNVPMQNILRKHDFGAKQCGGREILYEARLLTSGGAK